MGHEPRTTGAKVREEVALPSIPSEHERLPAELGSALAEYYELRASLAPEPG